MLKPIGFLRFFYRGGSIGILNSSIINGPEDPPHFRFFVQRRREFVQYFKVWSFAFELVDEDMHLDIVRHVSKGGFRIYLVIGIHIKRNLFLPNVDFVYFVWHHFDQFRFSKYSFTTLPSPVPFAPNRRLCLTFKLRAPSGMTMFV
jgi:hypothetical protein